MIAMELIGSPNNLVFHQLFRHLDYPSVKNLEYFILKMTIDAKMQLTIVDGHFPTNSILKQLYHR